MLAGSGLPVVHSHARRPRGGPLRCNLCSYAKRPSIRFNIATKVATSQAHYSRVNVMVIKCIHGNSVEWAEVQVGRAKAVIVSLIILLLASSTPTLGVSSHTEQTHHHQHNTECEEKETIMKLMEQHIVESIQDIDQDIEAGVTARVLPIRPCNYA